MRRSCDRPVQVISYNGAGWGPWRECLGVYKEEVQIVCGQELRLRGDAADGAVAAAKLDGWKVAMAQATIAQEPGFP